MKLNIYNDKEEIVKTYEMSTFKLKFGTVEDLIRVIDLDTLKTGNDYEVATIALNLVVSSLDTVKDLMKKIFIGLTDEELRNVNVDDMVQVLIDIVKHTISSLSFGNKGKN